MQKKNKKINSSQPKVYFWLLVSIFFFCLFSYGYMVQGSIVNVVARQSMEEEISLLNSSIIDLESAYIESKNAINLDTAYSLGFVPGNNQKFVTRNNSGLGLSLITNNN
jgi:hypothetical protein